MYSSDATTTRKGIVQLSNATDSVSETLAAHTESGSRWHTTC
ncbi:tail fiber protein [Salmonella enterica subsp. enterica]|nr:tail fiber protein [Salmonella enterica subsp. enterica]